MTRFVFVPAFAASLLASACAELPVDTTPPEDTHMVCQTNTLKWTLGQTADEALVTRAKAEATARTARVLRPGQVVTMEYSDQRLNLHVDAANKITSYACG